MRLYAKMRGEYNVNPGVDYTATSSTIALDKELNNNSNTINLNNAASSASVHGKFKFIREKVALDQISLASSNRSPITAGKKEKFHL